jgi:hypothetical protein
MEKCISLLMKPPNFSKENLNLDLFEKKGRKEIS